MTGPGGGESGPDARAFRDRFLAHLRARGHLGAGDAVVVACSGGLDSTVLLHLLRFSRGPELRLSAAHFDHRMRSGSAEDALWLRGVARAWEVPIDVGVAGEIPADEAQARTARYRFLREAKKARGARWLLTAHQADDQAETVLFRVVRGTGPKGLAGIPERGPGGLLRPLLPFRRFELERYAKGAGVPFRSDPSNLDPRFARNVLRHEVLPRLEREVAPGAVRSLARLARLAREDEEAWAHVLPGLLAPVLLEERPERIVLDRKALLGTAPPLRSRVLREALSRLGIVLGEAGTRRALEFTSSGASGGGVHLPGGALLAREFEHIVIERPRAGEDEQLVIGEPGEGVGRLQVGGRAYRVGWSGRGRATGGWMRLFRAGAWPIHSSSGDGARAI